MEFSKAFPIWDKLTPSEQLLLENTVTMRTISKGTVLHNGMADCMGLILVKTGQLRAFIRSDEGREITIYRLFEMDFCLFSASCILRSIQFDVTVEAEKDSEIFVIPPDIYKHVMEQSAVLANYTNEIMASRFSEIMWLIEQIMWKSQDKRLAAFLVEESRLENSTTLKLTHERIAGHLGTAREVITRMLRYLQREGLLRLTRGSIELLDVKSLETLAE